MIPRYDGILIWGFATIADLAFAQAGWLCLGGFWLGYIVAQSDVKLIDRWRRHE